MKNDVNGPFFVLSHCPHGKKRCDVSINTVYSSYMVEGQKVESLPSGITAPNEGGSENGSPVDSQRKRNLISGDHISEIENSVTFQHITHTVATLARFLIYKIPHKVWKG